MTTKTAKQTIDKLNQAWQATNLSAKQREKLEKEIEDSHLAFNKASLSEGNVPIISVVMSVYNTEKYVAAALESILNQTFSNFEIILIDDGSSDTSLDIVRSYKDPRIRIVHQNNHGLVYSFNKGVKLARGEYIARMDADDVCLPSRFEKELIWLLSNPKHGLVGTFFRYIEQETAAPLDVIQTSPLQHTDIMRMMYIVNPFGHGSVMYRKQAFLDAGGYRKEYEPSEDYDLWRRIGEKWTVGQIPEVLYLWRFQTSGLGNISQRKRKQSNDSAAQTVKNMWSMPLFDKSSASVIADGKAIKNMTSPLASTLYNQYVEHQLRLVEQFIEHGYLRAAIKTARGAHRLEPQLAKTRVRRPLLHAIVKRMMGKKR
jgi:glycosyltransferase involved in cell wall biosynthesis